MWKSETDSAPGRRGESKRFPGRTEPTSQGKGGKRGYQREQGQGREWEDEAKEKAGSQGQKPQ